MRTEETGTVDRDPAHYQVEDGVLERLSDREQAANIYRHLHSLSEPYKEVFLLRVLGSLKFKEIGDIFGRTETWAKVTFYRAKDKLVERMEEK